MLHRPCERCVHRHKHDSVTEAFGSVHLKDFNFPSQIPPEIDFTLRGVGLFLISCADMQRQDMYSSTGLWPSCECCWPRAQFPLVSARSQRCNQQRSVKRCCL